MKTKRLRGPVSHLLTRRTKAKDTTDSENAASASEIPTAKETAVN